jgi:hypothetical protein
MALLSLQQQHYMTSQYAYGDEAGNKNKNNNYMPFMSVCCNDEIDRKYTACPAEVQVIDTKKITFLILRVRSSRLGEC